MTDSFWDWKPFWCWQRNICRIINEERNTVHRLWWQGCKKEIQLSDPMRDGRDRKAHTVYDCCWHNTAITICWYYCWVEASNMPTVFFLSPCTASWLSFFLCVVAQLCLFQRESCFYKSFMAKQVMRIFKMHFLFIYFFFKEKTSTGRNIQMWCDGVPSMWGKENQSCWPHKIKRWIPNFISFHCIIHQESLMGLQNSETKSSYLWCNGFCTW